jgi:hypothetical protein
VLRRQHHQATVEVVGHVCTRARQGVDAGEAPATSQVRAQTRVQLLGDFVRLEVGEGLGRHVALLEGVGPGERLE